MPYSRETLSSCRVKPSSMSGICMGFHLSARIKPITETGEPLLSCNNTSGSLPKRIIFSYRKLFPNSTTKQIFLNICQAFLHKLVVLHTPLWMTLNCQGVDIWEEHYLRLTELAC